LLVIAAIESIYVNIFKGSLLAFIVHAEETEIFVLLRILFTILNSPLTAILVPIVIVPSEFAILNLVLTPFT
jgi:hypothetical protein